MPARPRLWGTTLSRAPDAVRAVSGYVPQEITSDKSLTGRENLRLFCRLYHLQRGEASRRTDELLKLLGLEEAADRLVRTYSGGMRKKLDLACGLVHKPSVLLLDEPSLGLDVHVRRAVWDYILALSSEGMGVVLATNSMEEAETLCRRLAIVDGGRVVASGTPAELKKGLGGDVVTLSFDAAHPMPPDLPGKLSPLEMVRRAVVEHGNVALTVSSNEEALPAILHAAREAGAAVSQATYSQPSLEAVFLTATGHRFSEPPGESDTEPKPQESAS